MTHPARLAPEDYHRRGLWVSLGSTAALLILGLLGWGAWHASQSDNRRVAEWLDAHQTGEDMFLIHDQEMRELCGTRADLKCIDTLHELKTALELHPNSHLLVSVPVAGQLTASTATSGLWRIDSRLDFFGTDYLLLRRDAGGTPLQEYLLGTN